MCFCVEAPHMVRAYTGIVQELPTGLMEQAVSLPFSERRTKDKGGLLQATSVCF